AKWASSSHAARRACAPRGVRSQPPPDSLSQGDPGMRRLPSLVAGLFVLAAALATPAAAENKGDLENMLYMETPHGRVVIKLRPDLAPNHVARVKELVRQKFYDGTPFHRVIPGFMAQGGDPTGTGTGGSGKKLKAEF